MPRVNHAKTSLVAHHDTSVFILHAFPVNSGAPGPVKVVPEPEEKAGLEVEVVAAPVPPVIPIMLRMYDPRGNVVVSLSVSSPEGPAVVSTIVVVYDPLFGEPGLLGAPGGTVVEIGTICVTGVGSTACPKLRLGCGGITGGAAEVDAVGAGGASGCDGGAGCGLPGLGCGDSVV